MRNLKNIFVTLFFGLLLINPALAIAANNSNNSTNNASGGLPQYNRGVDTSIRDYLCTPSESGDGHDLERCVNRLYKFGVAFGAIALVFFVVIAGYTYLTGGETSKNKAKHILQNALLGMGLLVGSYVLLYFINPNLVSVKVIQPPIFQANLPDCGSVGFGKDCVLTIDGGTIGSSNGVFGVAYDHDAAARAASQILSSSKITLNCYDNTAHGPKKNLQDAAAKKPSQTNDGQTYLHQDMLNGVLAIANAGYSICLSELAGGRHSDNSRHYVGLGLDIDSINGSDANKSNPASARVMELCRSNGATEVLGPVKPDAGHEGHVHCGWPRPQS